jgi:hypothetical protein
VLGLLSSSKDIERRCCGIWSPIDTERKARPLGLRRRRGGGGCRRADPPKGDTSPSVRNVTAAGGGVAVGGNVSGSTMNTPRARAAASTEDRPTVRA